MAALAGSSSASHPESSAPGPPVDSLTLATEKHAAFRNWCTDNDIELHSNLEIRISSGVPAAPRRDDLLALSPEEIVHHGMTVYTVSKKRIKKGEEATSIPKTAILSPRTSSLSKYDPTFVPCTVGGSKLNNETTSSLATPHLALCLLHEFILGARSRFAPYLATLPPFGVELPRHWVEGSPEYALIKHTDVEAHLKRLQRTTSADSPDHTVTDRFLRQFFFDKGVNHLDRAHPGLVSSAAEPVASTSTSTSTRADAVVLRLDQIHELAHSRSFSRDELWTLYDMAATLVSTRSFVIDLFHVLAMVPVADAFDHRSTNNVEFECDDIVCPECGALDVCEHEDLGEIEPMGRKEEPQTVALTFNRDCTYYAGRTPVYNSYGDLSAHEVLLRFGFTPSLHSMKCFWPSPLVEDEYGIEVARALSNSLPDAQRAAIVVDAALLVTRDPQVKQERPHFYRMDTDECIANQEPPMNPIIDYSATQPSRWLYIDQAGFISDSLWLLALALAVDETRPDTLDVSRLLEVNEAWWRPVEAQVEAERAGKLAISKIRRLVERRIARLEEAYSDEMMKDISLSPSLPFAIRGAAVYNSHERDCLTNCLAVLIRFTAVTERKELSRMYSYRPETSPQP
ncbi:hypothetical protein CF326_g3873 [Tilletia indica]|nr:hypothetical protein CF326_g3873 [Tilletia indica]